MERADEAELNLASHPVGWSISCSRLSSAVISSEVENVLFCLRSLRYSDLVFRACTLLILTAAVAISQEAPASDIRVTLERRGSGMVLSSPQYKVTIEQDGSVTFEGEHNVSALGTHRRKIQRNQVRELARRFEEMGYFGLPEHTGTCTDAATVVTSVKIGSRAREVRHWECEDTPELTHLEDEIDRVANSRVWIRGHLRIWLHWPWFHSQN